MDIAQTHVCEAKHTQNKKVNEIVEKPLYEIRFEILIKFFLRGLKFPTRDQLKRKS